MIYFLQIAMLFYNDNIIFYNSTSIFAHERRAAFPCGSKGWWNVYRLRLYCPETSKTFEEFYRFGGW